MWHNGIIKKNCTAAAYKSLFSDVRKHVCRAQTLTISHRHYFNSCYLWKWNSEAKTMNRVTPSTIWFTIHWPGEWRYHEKVISSNDTSRYLTEECKTPRKWQTLHYIKQHYTQTSISRKKRIITIGSHQWWHVCADFSQNVSLVANVCSYGDHPPHSCICKMQIDQCFD